MLKKLMKYEFMATGRIYLPLFAALIILSGVNRLLSYLPVTAPQSIGIVIAVILIVGIMVLTFILTLQRFRSNLLSNEGHLMMTLPVGTDHLILSKLFTAAIWGIASFLVVTASIMIMAMKEVTFADIASALRNFGNLISTGPGQAAIYTLEIVVMIVISLFTGILLLYACMSLSMLVNKHRGLFTFGAFIVITTAVQTISAILISILVAMELTNVLNISGLGTFGMAQTVILNLLLCEAVLCVVFYFITRYMLKKRLNLQ